MMMLSVIANYVFGEISTLSHNIAMKVHFLKTLVIISVNVNESQHLWKLAL